MRVLDFETEAIVGNTSAFPPKPVGLAVRDGLRREYITDWEQMGHALAEAWHDDMLFHSAKFDVSVARHHFKLPAPDPLKVHDTTYLIFLNDPHAPSLSLKPSAARILGEPPVEQDILRDWILHNVEGATKKNFGAFIARAPKEIVGPYAIGDVDRTFRLYEKLMPEIKSKGMEEAYVREQLLCPILVDAEERGLRVDMPALSESVDTMTVALKECDSRIHKLLGYTFNVDSSDELAQALDKAGLVQDWPLTPTGRRSTAKDALQRAVTSPEVLALLLYRSGLDTCLNTFGISWYNQALRESGRVHPTWNQVRQEGHGVDFKGTRSGRISCDHPNLTNPPNELKAKAPAGLLDIPLMRRFLLPEEGHLWVKRDFASQEIRVLAHYEDGALMKAYQEKPDFDPHNMALGIIQDLTGLDVSRREVKIVAFSIIYGSGVSGLAAQLGCDYAKAKSIREAYMAAIPGIRIISDALRRRGRAGLPLKTWGGRLYLPEPPKMIKGRMMDFLYKLLNYLIQPSAADLTKQTIIDWGCPSGQFFLASLYDEINISVPIGEEVEAMAHLKEVMNRDRLDVPMLSDGFIGENFGELHAVES